MTGRVPARGGVYYAPSRTIVELRGIVRTDKRLDRAERRLDNLVGEIQEYYWGYLVTRDVVDLRNLADVARLIVACAEGAQGEPRAPLHVVVARVGSIRHPRHGARARKPARLSHRVSGSHVILATGGHLVCWSVRIPLTTHATVIS
jgi:hypothetical protein